MASKSKTFLKQDMSDTLLCRRVCAEWMAFMRSRTVGAGHARPAAFQEVHAYPYKLEVVTLISARTIFLKLQFSQTTYTFLHLDYKCLYLSNPIQTGEAHLYL